MFRIDELQKTLKEFISLSELEIDLHFQKLIWQPDVPIHLARSYFLYERFKFRSYRLWFGYGYTVSLIRTLLFEAKALLKGRSQLQLSEKLLYVATIVSQKNLRAWEGTVDLELDASLILEDDAIINKESIKVLRDALLEISPNHPVYFNLARGNNLNSYKFTNYQSDKGTTKWLEAPIADTACAYLINNSAARILLNEYRKINAYDGLAIDFILSDIFIQNREIAVLHSKTPPFTNGTIFGNFESQTGALIRDDL